MKQLMRNMTLDLKAGGCETESLLLVMHVCSSLLVLLTRLGTSVLCSSARGLSHRISGVVPRVPIIVAPLGTRWKRVKGLRCLVWSFDSCVSSEKVFLKKRIGV